MTLTRKPKPVSTRWRNDRSVKQGQRWTNKREERVKRRSSRSRERAKWERDLTKWVRENLPERCEMCGTSQMLSKAHSKKRRFINTREDYFEIALLCIPCHEKIEYIGHAEMEAAIKELIAKRSEI